MLLIRRFLLMITIIFVFFYVCVAAFIAFYPGMNDIPDKKYMGVVFGAGITRSSEPSPALKFRLDKAIEIYGNKKIDKIFISGETAEIVIMKNYLLKNGIDGKSIIVDSDGKNTLVTVGNVRKFIMTNGIQDGVIFISQRYHIPRIALIAWKKGLNKALFIAADTKKIEKHESIIFVARESLGFIKSLLFD